MVSSTARCQAATRKWTRASFAERLLPLAEGGYADIKVQFFALPYGVSIPKNGGIGTCLITTTAPRDRTSQCSTAQRAGVPEPETLKHAVRISRRRHRANAPSQNRLPLISTFMAGGTARNTARFCDEPLVATMVPRIAAHVPAQPNVDGSASSAASGKSLTICGTRGGRSSRHRGMPASVK